MSSEKEIDTYYLALQRTKLANLRTYLAYMRTGFVVASLAGIFKKKLIVILSILLMMVSTIQYLYINYKLDQNLYYDNTYLNLLPIFLIMISGIVLYIHYFHRKLN